jgi:hypothetical protein
LALAISNTRVERAYVELREDDDDGGEMLAVVVFSFRTKSRLSSKS